MPIGPLLARAGSFLLKRGFTIGSTLLNRPHQPPTPTATQKNDKPALHTILDTPKHTTDNSFIMSLLTILAIPILFLYALFEIILKTSPFPTGLQ